MEEDRLSVHQAVEELKRGEAAGEHVLNIVKAVISAAGSVGGFIGSLMNDYIPSRKHERLIGFAHAVAEDLQSLSDRVKEEYVRNDEFAYLFEQCFKGVAENYDKTKIAAYRNLLRNALLHPEVQTDRKEMYLRILNDLLPSHIVVLSALYQPVQFAERLGIKTKTYGFSTSLSQLLHDLFPSVSEDDMYTIVRDLDAAGLSSNVAGGYRTMMSGGGVEKLQGRLTSLGQEVLKFISE